jgi:hypothetical protein
MGADWINGAADTDQCWAVVKTVMNLLAPWNMGNFLTSWETVSFSGRTQDVTHWTHVFPAPQPKQTSHTLPSRAPWVWNTATGLATFGTALPYITVCLSSCNVALITHNPSKIITTWGAVSHIWQRNDVLYRCSRYTGFVKFITFLVRFLALEVLIGKKKNYFVEPLGSPRGLRFEIHCWNWKQRSKTLDGMPRGSASVPIGSWEPAASPGAWLSVHCVRISVVVERRD